MNRTHHHGRKYKSGGGGGYIPHLILTPGDQAIGSSGGGFSSWVGYVVSYCIACEGKEQVGIALLFIRSIFSVDIFLP